MMTGMFLGNIVGITVAVTDGTSPVSNATVDIVITTPKGDRWIYSGLTTGADGVATSRHKARGKDVGANDVDATASMAGFKNGSGSATFEVAK